VLENRMLRRTFVPKRKEVTGGWRKIHNQELHNLYSSTNIIRVSKWSSMSLMVHEVHMGEMKNA
jgi:hypothetical protein